uniref:Putative calcium-transporting ATPase 2, plasma membrane-type protein n=1 Tax=Davidia involucrata TaxID=16924 RepID=A0A5B7BRJ0_DAVIN
MESYLKENFREVKPKNSSSEALQRWRKLCWIVKNRKRRFRFSANLSRRFEAWAIQSSNQVSLSVHIFVFFSFVFSVSLLRKLWIQRICIFLKERVIRIFGSGKSIVNSVMVMTSQLFTISN